MRRSVSTLLGFTMLVAAGLVPSSASAGSGGSIEQQLAGARSDRRAAAELARSLEVRVDALTTAYRDATGQLQVAAQQVLAAYREHLIVSAELAEAQHALDSEAAEAYEAGPGLPIELVLGAKSASDLASVQEFAARAMGSRSDAIERVKTLRASMGSVSGDLQRRQDELWAAVKELGGLATQALDQLAQAKVAAEAAGQKIKGLEERQRKLASAQSLSSSTISALVDAQRGVDQRRLLAMLGPNQGRGCEIPPGLADTGQRMQGIASWYGPGFAGRPTASGAIYDPRLFTAANKELPLNTFLRVHFNGRCAVVLVNDRGPYAPGRVFDLSQATAEYLGLGLDFVTADVLIPA